VEADSRREKIMISNRQLEIEYDEKFWRWQQERESRTLKPAATRKPAPLRDPDLRALRNAPSDSQRPLLIPENASPAEILEAWRAAVLNRAFGELFSRDTGENPNAPAD
jgi:hypothetical protein